MFEPLVRSLNWGNVEREAQFWLNPNAQAV